MQGSYIKEINSKFKTQVNAKYAFYRTHYVNNDDKLIHVDNLYKQREIYLSSANVYSILSNWDVSASYDLQWNKMNADMYGFVYPERFTNLLSVATALRLGKVKLQGDDLVVNFSQTKPKTKEEAKLETHNQFIDIQIPLSGVEVMGYTAREDLPEADYDADKDISFYPGLAESYIPVKPGMFAIFFPQDAHAPGVSPDGVKKVIVKVLV